MQREVWRLTIKSKRFYVSTFRFAEKALIFFMVLNVLLGLGVVYAYFQIPMRHYYATNGEVPPLELTPMDAPNETSIPLLAADPEIDDDKRIIPK